MRNHFPSLKPNIKALLLFWNWKCNPSIAIQVLSDRECDRILRGFAA
jgi:hypothetical protein